MTRAQIEAQLRADLANGIVVSVNGKAKTIPPGTAEYDQRIAEMADAMFAQQAVNQIATREAAQRDLAKTAYAALNAGTATNAQVQKVVAWLLRQQVMELQSEFPA